MTVGKESGGSFTKIKGEFKMDNKQVILSYEDHEELLKKAAEADKKEHTYSLVIRKDYSFFYEIKAFSSEDAIIAEAVEVCNREIRDLQIIHNSTRELLSQEIDKNSFYTFYKRAFWSLLFIFIAGSIYFMFIK
jgi:hypothetical protein